MSGVEVGGGFVMMDNNADFSYRQYSRVCAYYLCNKIIINMLASEQTNVLKHIATLSLSFILSIA